MEGFKVTKLVSIALAVVGCVVLLSHVNNESGSVSQGKNWMMSKTTPLDCAGSLEVASLEHDGLVTSAENFFNVKGDGVLSYYDRKGRLQKRDLSVENAMQAGLFRIADEHKHAIVDGKLVYLLKDNTLITVNGDDCKVDGVYMARPDGDINDLVSETADKSDVRVSVSTDVTKKRLRKDCKKCVENYDNDADNNVNGPGVIVQFCLNLEARLESKLRCSRGGMKTFHSSNCVSGQGALAGDGDTDNNKCMKDLCDKIKKCT